MVSPHFTHWSCNRSDKRPARSTGSLVTYGLRQAVPQMCGGRRAMAGPMVAPRGPEGPGTASYLPARRAAVRRGDRHPGVA